MADERTPPPEEGDDWPDRWDEADRAWEEKWGDSPPRPGAEPAPETEAAFVEPLPTGPRPPAPNPLDAYNEGMRVAGPYLGLGLQIALSMAFFVGVGYAVDRWLGSSPWGLLIGAVLGMVGVFALIIRLSNQASAQQRERRRERGG